jgi:hypothetical protein
MGKGNDRGLFRHQEELDVSSLYINGRVTQHSSPPMTSKSYCQDGKDLGERGHAYLLYFAKTDMAPDQNKLEVGTITLEFHGRSDIMRQFEQLSGSSAVSWGIPSGENRPMFSEPFHAARHHHPAQPVRQPGHHLEEIRARSLLCTVKMPSGGW